MSEKTELSKLEHIKEGSRRLRGSILTELQSDDAHFSEASKDLLKFHGTYQQDDRDLRTATNPDGGKKSKTYIFMVRTRIPGGKVTAEQFLTELDLCEQYGNGTVRITSRQGYQLHGVVKGDLRDTIQAINESKLTTLGACGDNERNVMCCPAPYRNNTVRDEMQEMADRVADRLKLPAEAYTEIWLKNGHGEDTKVSEIKPTQGGQLAPRVDDPLAERTTLRAVPDHIPTGGDEEPEHPIYGKRMLPRKFKTAFALPEDNCIDVYTQDLGFLAIVENDAIVGYNVLVGGGMGVTPSKKATFPALARRMSFVTPNQVLDLAEAVVKVQRDFGNRADRKVARMKYLIADWGLEKFKAKVEEYYGHALPEPHPADVTDVDDHIGWHEQGDGKWFLGLNIENGRIKDEGAMRLKSGLRAIVSQYRMSLRNTPLQGLILCDIDPVDREDINRMLAEHGIKQEHELSLVRRYAMACPALPTCGLSVTESERVMPGLTDALEAEIARHGLSGERISVHMTGCPNGCARPYTPDIGLVGKTVGKYTVYLGGNAEGTRLAFLYKDLVPFDEIVLTVSPLLAYYKAGREDGESFGDFCYRKGPADLATVAEQSATETTGAQR